ncbi:MAG TPA: glycosyltransferase family 39 protein [Pyrinomonadaceae bacterium]
MPLSSQIRRLLPQKKALAADIQPEERGTGRLRGTTVSICLVIFLTAIGVRLFHWQDNRPIFSRIFTGMVEQHKSNARLLLKGDIATFITGPAPPGDANILTYPPGYPIIMAIVFRLFGDSDTSMRAFQIICDAAAAVLLFCVAAELLPIKLAALAGALAALSPQLAYYSLLLLPDSLATLPILLALYFIIRSQKTNSLPAIMAAGALIGLSCWLRSNALLLAPFLAVLLLIITGRGRRWRYASAFVGACILVIAPITIRNLVVFHHFIPLSLGAGQMLNVGINDYDKQRRFGLPGTDIETVTMEAKRYQRPDYAGSLFGGNGIERERERTARALAVVRSHPIWFAGVVLRRAAFMLKFERVATVSAAPAVTHSLNLTEETKPAWSNAPQDFVSSGMATQSQAQISVAADGPVLRIESAALRSGNQIVSVPIAVEKYNDYLFRLPVRVDQGNVVISITSTDQKRIYGSTPVLHHLETLPGSEQPTFTVQIPFVSRDADSMRLIISNDQRGPAPTVVQVGKMELFQLGPASLLWTEYLRVVIHLGQRFFVTAWILPLALLGGILLKGAGYGRFLAILLAIPLYYVAAQSFLHSEYRYVMAIQPPLFILVAVTLYWLGTTSARIIGKREA